MPSDVKSQSCTQKKPFSYSYFGGTLIQEPRRIILINMELLLRKLQPSSAIRFTLIFMTRIIRLMSIDILLWGNRRQVAY